MLTLLAKMSGNYRVATEAMYPDIILKFHLPVPDAQNAAVKPVKANTPFEMGISGRIFDKSVNFSIWA